MARKSMFFLKQLVKFIFLAFLSLISILGLNWLSPVIAKNSSVPTENLTVVNNSINNRVNKLNNIYGDASLNNIQPSLQELLNPGIAAYQNGEFAKAKDLWNKAIKVVSGDKLYQALVNNYLSLTYQQLGELDKAEIAVKESLELLNSLPNTSEVWQVRARSLSTQGRWQLAQGKLEDALENLKQAEEIYIKLKDNQGAIGSQINQAQILQASGRYRRALSVLTKVKENIKNQQDDRLKATALLNLGNTLQVVGDLENSWCILQESLETAEKTSSPQLIADIWLSLGNIDRSFGRKAEDLLDDKNKNLSVRNIKNCKKNPEEKNALEFYKQAEKWYQQVNNNQFTSLNNRVQSQLNHVDILLGILAQKTWKNEWDNAFNTATKLINNIGLEIDNLPVNRRGIYARINFARNLTILQQKASKTQNKVSNISSWNIENLLKNAVEYARNIQDKRAESYALGNLGWFYEQKENWQQARKLTEKSLKLAEEIKSPDIVYQWEWQLGRIAIAENQNDQAIKEYNNAVETLSEFRQSLLAINLNLEKEVNSDLQFYFRDRVEPVYRKLVDLLLKSNKYKNREKAVNVIEDLKKAELDNFLRCSIQQEQSVKIENIDSKAAVIYTIILDNSLDTIVKFSNQKLKHYSFSISKNDLEKQLINIVNKINKPVLANDDIDNLKDLYKYLLKKVEEELNNNKPETLVFVLDGLLQNIPMSALMYDDNKYLIEKYSIAQTPGLKLLNSEKMEKDFQILAAGVSEANEGLIPLPNVKTELDKIKNSFPKTQVLLNKNFSSNKFTKEIKSLPVSIVHLATHGQFSSQLDYTYIAAWQNKIKINELYELLQTRTQINPNVIELMFLSACQTAQGDKRAALGLAGVAVQAGSRSTIATLWSVKDDSSAILADKFYKYLSSPTISNKAKALQLAQLDLLKQENYKQPRYWAPYVLVGNWL